MNIAIVGTGYVGLVTGACFADFGHTVCCVEARPSRVADLRAGRLPFFEPGLGELMHRNVSAGRLQFTNCLEEAVACAGVVFLAVLADTLLVLWRRLDDVPAEQPLPWCYGVARGVLANQRRGERRRLALLDRVLRLDPPPAAAPPPDDDGAPPEVGTALATLAEADRELLRLWAWEELGAAEIAVVLGTTPNAASIRLHRARGRLRRALEVVKAGGPALVDVVTRHR